MKHWKALLIALVVLVLTFACTAALAADDPTEAEILAGATKSERDCGHKDLTLAIRTPAKCTTAGVKVQICKGCGKVFYTETIPAKGHTATGNWIEAKANSCTTDGLKYKVCKDCGEHAVEEVIPKTGHDTNGAQWFTVTSASCAAEGEEGRNCWNCGKTVETRKVPKTNEHVWSEGVEPEVKATCTTDGKTRTDQCFVCGAYKGGKVIKALGHIWGEPSVVAATCTKDGSSTKTCKDCGAKDVTVLKATGHKKAWRVVKEATASADGVKEQYCKTCGLIFGTETYPLTKMLYQNNVTGFGPRTKELIGGKTWERITPIDLSVEGKKTYDLVASDAYVVGTATVEIAEGKLTVTYNTVKCVDVRQENLTIYANTAALADPTEDTAKTFKYGEAIDIAENFGEDNIVLLGIHLIADYDQIGAGVTPFRPAQSDIDALKALAD